MCIFLYAGVLELEYRLDLGSSALKGLGVRSPPPANLWPGDGMVYIIDLKSIGSSTLTGSSPVLATNLILRV